MKIKKSCRGLQTEEDSISLPIPILPRCTSYKPIQAFVLVRNHSGEGKKTVSSKQANHCRSITVSEDQRSSVFTTSLASVSLVNYKLRDITANF